MRLKACLSSLAAVFAIAAAVRPGTVGAAGAMCQPGPGNGAGVNIHVSGPNGSSDTWCSAAAIQTQAAALGPVQNPAGGPAIRNGISIRNLLRMARVLPGPVHLVLLSRLNGTPSTLDRAELLDPASSFVGGAPALVEVTSSQAEYIRPERSPTTSQGSPADRNSETIADAPLDLSVFSGRALAVNIATGGSSSTFAPGKAVQFTASPTGPGYSYTWSFGDGSHAPGATVSHTFTRPVQAQDVYVTVKGPDGSAGVHWTQVTIARTPKHRGYKPPPTTHTNPTPGTGGNSGNTNPPLSNGTNPNPGNPTSPSGSPSTTTHTHSTTRSRVSSNALGQHGGTIVSGRLISDVAPVSPAQLATSNVPPTPRFSTPIVSTTTADNGSVKPIAALAAACAVALLLVSGAGRELRSLRRSIASARLG